MNQIIKFPLKLDLNESGEYPKTFETLEDLQKFYWNCSLRQAEELEDIFKDEGININAFLNSQP